LQRNRISIIAAALLLFAAYGAAGSGWRKSYAADATNVAVALYAKLFTETWAIGMSATNATDCSVSGRNDLFPTGFFTNKTYVYSDYYDAGLNTNLLRWATNRPAVTSLIVQGSAIVGTAVVSRTESGGVVNVNLQGEDLFSYDVACALQERLSVIQRDGKDTAPFSDYFYYRYDHELISNPWGDIDNLEGAKRTAAMLCEHFIDTNTPLLDTFSTSNLLQYVKLPTNYFDFSYNKIHFNPFPPRYRYDTNPVVIIPLPDQPGPIYTNIIENPDGSRSTCVGTNGQRFGNQYVNSNICLGFDSSAYQATNLIPIINRLRFVRWSDESTGVINRRKYRYSKSSSDGFNKWWDLEGCGSSGTQVKNEVIRSQTNDVYWDWGSTSSWERLTNRINAPRSTVLTFTFAHSETIIKELYRQEGVFYVLVPPDLDSFVIDYSTDDLSVSGQYECQYPSDFVVRQRGRSCCIPKNGVLWSAAMWPGGFVTNLTYNAFSNSYTAYSGAGVHPFGGDAGAWGVELHPTTYSIDHVCNDYEWMLNTNGYHLSKGPVVPIRTESNSVFAATNHPFPLVYIGRPSAALAVIDSSFGVGTYGFGFQGLCEDGSGVFTRSGQMSYSHQATISAAKTMIRSGSGYGFMDFATPGGFKYYYITKGEP
jgi:hypothetical protein